MRKKGEVPSELGDAFGAEDDRYVHPEKAAASVPSPTRGISTYTASSASRRARRERIAAERVAAEK